jgi:DNA-directed RNA polymerase specialized sigma24 family protein
MTNQEIFNHIERGNSQAVLAYFFSFSKPFYYTCKKQDKSNLLNEHHLQSIFHDACILMYEKIESKQITLLQMTSSVKTMVFGIGKKKAFKEVRDEQSYYSLHSFVENNFNDFFDGDDNESLFKELEMQHLTKALPTLSLKHHALIVEGVIEEKSNSEIAKEQGYASANAVAVEKIRAFKALKAAILEIQKQDEDYFRQ